MGFFGNVRGFNKIQNLIDNVESVLVDIYREFPTLHRQQSILKVIEGLNQMENLSNRIKMESDTNSLAVQSTKYNFCKKQFRLFEIYTAIEGMEQKIVLELLQHGIMVRKFGNEWKYM